MSQNSENVVIKFEVVVEEAGNDQKDENNTTNTLKSVRKRIRNFTIRRKPDEKSKSDSINDQNEMNQEKCSDESSGKSKITLKKIFRKSSFKKFITNIQHFTNFTVSGLGLCIFIHKRREKKKKLRAVYRKKKKIARFARMTHKITTQIDFCSD